MDLSQDYFSLFGLPALFELDGEELARRFRAAQTETHPDRFAAAPDEERLRALQLASHVNEAYQTLKEPLRRGRYLLERLGRPLDEHNNRAMSPAFLMEQMELREALAGARRAADPAGEVAAMLDQVQRRLRAMTAELAAAFAAGDEAGLTRAATLLLELQFVRRLEEEALALEEELL